MAEKVHDLLLRLATAWRGFEALRPRLEPLVRQREHHVSPLACIKKPTPQGVVVISKFSINHGNLPSLSGWHCPPFVRGPVGTQQAIPCITPCMYQKTHPSGGRGNQQVLNKSWQPAQPQWLALTGPRPRRRSFSGNAGRKRKRRNGKPRKPPEAGRNWKIPRFFPKI